MQAIVEVTAQEGYAQSKIGALAQRAGISRATFYELFPNKEACFLAAQRELGLVMRREVVEAVDRSAPADAALAAVTALARLASRDPAAFVFLTHEAMLAGPRPLNERERLIDELQSTVEQRASKASSALVPDIPAKLLLGGVLRTLGIHIRRGQVETHELPAALGALIEAYRAPADKRRWVRVAPVNALFERTQGGASLGTAPPRLPRGRHRLAPDVVEQVQRSRILHATAEVVRSNGYPGTTVADIVSVAGVSREVFYTHFHDKHRAFEDTLRLAFEQIVAASAGAFFISSSAWPERVWESGRAFTSFAQEAPSFAHFAFVDSYAAGPAIAARTDEGVMAFTLFMEDGYRYGTHAAGMPRVASELIAGMILETASSFIRQSRSEELPGLLPLTTYVILAPFLGARAANQFVDGKLRELSIL